MVAKKTVDKRPKPLIKMIEDIYLICSYHILELLAQSRANCCQSFGLVRGGVVLWLSRTV